MGQSGSERSQSARAPSAPRCIGIVGPFQSGKTTLLEAILERTGALARAGRVSEGSSLGDGSAEARAHAHGVEPNIASATFIDERFTFIDCPGSVEFSCESRAVLPACDAAVVVCETDERKLPALQVILRDLEEAGIPRFLFLNKIDTATRRIQESLAMLQQASALRQAAPNGQVSEAALKSLPPGTVSYSFTSYSSGNGASCSQSVQVTALGQNQPPKVERQSQGDCSAVNTRKPTPAVIQAKPDAPRVTPAGLQKPADAPKPKGPII